MLAGDACSERLVLTAVTHGRNQKCLIFPQTITPPKETHLGAQKVRCKNIRREGVRTLHGSERLFAALGCQKLGRLLVGPISPWFATSPSSPASRGPTALIWWQLGLACWLGADLYYASGCFSSGLGIPLRSGDMSLGLALRPLLSEQVYVIAKGQKTSPTHSQLANNPDKTNAIGTSYI